MLLQLLHGACKNPPLANTGTNCPPIATTRICSRQGGITCGAIDEPRKSSKAIDERVIINFRDKNVVIARFRDKNVYRQLFCSIDRFSVLSKAFLFYPQLFCSINMANIFEFLSKDGNITPEKVRKSRQMQFRDKTAYVWGLRYR